MTQMNPLPPEEKTMDEYIPSSQVDSDIEGQKRNRMLNATWGASLLTVAGLLFVIVGFFIADINSWKDYILLGAPAVLFILGLTSISFLRRGRIVLGTGLIFVANLVMPLVESLFQTDIGLPVFIYTLVSSALLIWRTLPRASRRWASILAGIALVFIAGVEWANPPFRISPADELVAVIIAATSILTISFIIQSIRQAWGRSMRNKLLVAFIGVTLVATGALSVFMYITTTNNLQDNLERELSEVAISRAIRVGDLFNEQINQLTTLTLDDVLQQSIAEQNRSYEGDAAAIQAVLDARDTRWRAADEADNDRDFLVQQNLTNDVAEDVTEYQEAFPGNIEVFVTDIYGGMAGSTNRTSDYYQADEGWWQAAYSNGAGAVYIGEPEYDESADAIGVNIALPIRSRETGEIIGILRTTYMLSALETILADNIGETGSTDLFVPGEVTVSHVHEGGLEETVPGLFEQLQEVYGQGMVELVYEDVLSVVTQAPVQTLEGNPDIDNLGWVIAFHQHRDEAFAPINAQVRGLVIVMAIVVALAAAAAFGFSIFLVRPIIQLTQTAEEVSAGDLDSRAEVTTTDEVGTLATAFNTMTSQLQETLGGLEQRVAERTQNLELAAEVGRSVSQVRELEVMLRDACDLILKEFDLYYVQVYLTDPSQTRLVLEAGTGEVGAQLLARSHSLPFNTASINGRAAVEKRTVVISDTAQSATFRPNVLLPDTRGEMAVPLIVGENVVGVLDMQTTVPGVLNEEVLPAFEALAGQLAVAVQNANLVAEAEQARAEVEAQARRLVRQGWDEHLDAIHKPEQIGYVFDRTEVTPLEDIEETELPEGKAVSAPISLTGEMLGSLLVEIDEERQNEQTSELVNTVARLVAQQLENLRLLESSERYRFEAEQTARRQTREGWQQYIQSRTEKGLGYLYDLTEVRPHSNGKDDPEALTLPLKAREETVGKLSIQGLAPDDRESFELASAVAERLGTVIENLRLSEQTKQSLALTDELYGISQSVNEADSEAELLEALAKPAMEAGATGANLMYIDMNAEGNPEWSEIVAGWRSEGEDPIPVGTRFYLPDLPFSKLWMADPENPLLVSDTETDERLDEGTRAAIKQGDTRAIAIIPLTRGQEQVGLVSLSWDQPHEFGQHEKETYAAIIGLASPAVHGRRLFGQAQKQAERETMLNTINQKIQSATSVEAVLQIAARELGHALGAPMTIAQLSMKDQKN